jgi:uridylate kinase
MKNPDAERYQRLTYREVLQKDLRVMDATAIAHARENNIPILVFSVHDAGALVDVVQSRGNFTLIEAGG